MEDFGLDIRRSVPGLQCSGPGQELNRFGWRIGLQGGWEGDSLASACGFRSTPGWPEPASLRVEWDTQGVRLIPDHACVATIFFRPGADNSGDLSALAASTDFGQIIQGSDIRIRPQAIEECVCLGHALGSGTLVEGVLRIRHGQVLSLHSDGQLRVESDVRTCPLSIPADRDAILSLRDSSQFRGMDASAIELTAGLDSRLSLAILLAANSPPAHACTFGEAGSIDVQTAQRLAKAFGIEHHILRLGCNHPASISRGSEHVLNSGGLLSFSKYTPLMGELASADDWRASQVSGLGGELGINFYQLAGTQSQTQSGRYGRVIRHRIIQVPPALEAIAGEGVRCTRQRIEAEIEGILAGYPVDGEQSLRWFYVRERMSNWAFVGLNANRFEYGLRLPLLTREYIQWANSLSSRDRNDRRGQLGLIREIARGIDGGASLTKTRVAGARGLKRVINHAWKYARRRLSGSDPRGEGGSQHVLELAINDSRLGPQLEHLADLEVFGRRYSPDDLRVLAQTTDLLVGMYLTAAVVLDRAATGSR